MKSMIPKISFHLSIMHYTAHVLMLIIALFFVASPSQGQSTDTLRSFIQNHPKISNPDPILDAFTAHPDSARVIIHYKKPDGISQITRLATPNQRNSMRVRIRSARNRLTAEIKSSDIQIGKAFDYIPALPVSVTPEGLRMLASRSDIVFIEPDLVIQAHTSQGMALMQANAIRNIYGGEGVAIAVCDTGIDYTHDCFGGGGFPNDKVIGGYDFGGSNPNFSFSQDGDPMDTVGHGTQCAGIAAGTLPANGDYIGGVAPQAKLYALKISPDGQGWAYESDMIAAWEWCVTHQDDDPTHPIMVISTSFGGGANSGVCDSVLSAMTQAAENATTAGITLFASSGNEGYCGQMAWPACISHVISVAAVFDANVGGYGYCVDDSTCAVHEAYSGCATGYITWVYSTQADQVIPYSNISEALDLFAPSNLASTPTMGGGFVTNFGGTSAACPYAAGIAALMQSAAKTVTGSFLTPAQIKDRLTASGDPTSYDPVGITRPRINLAATDIDGDTLPSGWEIDNFGTLGRDGSGDLDNDTLTDLSEYLLGTQPDNPDTDYDGCTDGIEAAANTDPLDPLSFPKVVRTLGPGALLAVALILLIAGSRSIRTQNHLSPVGARRAVPLRRKQIDGG